MLDIHLERARHSDKEAVYAEAVKLGERFGRLHERPWRVSDSLSVRPDGERQLVRSLALQYRTLPEEERQELPALLNAIAKLEMASGDFEQAQTDFQTVAKVVSDVGSKADSHFAAYEAAVQCRNWKLALAELLRAVEGAPSRFAPFPLDKYEPERILGAGGFGVVFLCKQKRTGARVVIKAIRTDDLERSVDDLFQEAAALEQVEHANVIRPRDSDFVENDPTRPYLVMDYFEGVTLDEHVRERGPLPLDDFLEVGRQLAEGLDAAHQKGVLHRDVKPRNVLIRRTGDSWQVKIIDFGLALRRDVLTEAKSNTDALERTVAGHTIAGTLDYSAPEQLGRLKEPYAVGPYSDVFGFARTCCLALFGTHQPGPRQWRSVTDANLVDLLGESLAEKPTERPQSFAAVLERWPGASKRPRRKANNTPTRWPMLSRTATTAGVYWMVASLFAFVVGGLGAQGAIPVQLSGALLGTCFIGSLFSIVSRTIGLEQTRGRDALAGVVGAALGCVFGYFVPTPLAWVIATPLVAVAAMLNGAISGWQRATEQRPEDVPPRFGGAALTIWLAVAVFAGCMTAAGLHLADSWLSPRLMPVYGIGVGDTLVSKLPDLNRNTGEPSPAAKLFLGETTFSDAKEDRYSGLVRRAIFETDAVLPWKVPTHMFVSNPKDNWQHLFESFEGTGNVVEVLPSELRFRFDEGEVEVKFDAAGSSPRVRVTKFPIRGLRLWSGSNSSYVDSMIFRKGDPIPPDWLWLNWDWRYSSPEGFLKRGFDWRMSLRDWENLFHRLGWNARRDVRPGEIVLEVKAGYGDGVKLYFPYDGKTTVGSFQDVPATAERIDVGSDSVPESLFDWPAVKPATKN